jgi:hypothetical protein
VHDIADLELRGVPGVFVATTEFVSAAVTQSASLGIPDLKRVYTSHPIQDRTDEEMIDLAERCFDEILAAITA